jgi:magnesium-transporting ATPase (P-type)
VGLDGSLEPLPPERVQALKACCGRGGLRVLALAYKDMLLSPTRASSSAGGAAAGGGSAAGPQQQQQQGSGGPEWQLLDGDDDDQKDLVLIGLLALEDPGGLWGRVGRGRAEWDRCDV